MFFKRKQSLTKITEHFEVIDQVLAAADQPEAKHDLLFRLANDRRSAQELRTAAVAHLSQSYLRNTYRTKALEKILNGLSEKIHDLAQDLPQAGELEKQMKELMGIYNTDLDNIDRAAGTASLKHINEATN